MRVSLVHMISAALRSSSQVPNIVAVCYVASDNIPGTRNALHDARFEARNIALLSPPDHESVHRPDP